MVCKNCEKEVMEEAYYCPYCGAKLKEYELEVPLEEEVQTVAPETTGKESTMQTEEKPTNDMALIGFVGSFVSPLLGFALGGVGLARSFKKKGAGRGFSIAALCVSAFTFIVNMSLQACNMLFMGY